MPVVTTDVFVTLLSLLDLDHPDSERPLDGEDLSDLIKGREGFERQQPIGFWKYDRRLDARNERWMASSLTKGPTPTTRNPGIDFVNFRHPVARTENFGGVAAWMEAHFKLVRAGANPAELYDLLADPFETADIAAGALARVAQMTAAMEKWQRSVERSLSGADY